MRRATSLVFGVVACLSLAASTPARADFLLSNYNHTNTIRNRTGRVASDLHVEVPTQPSDPSSPAFTTAKAEARSIDFSGGTVGINGTATINFKSKQARDMVLAGNWTGAGGANIGAFDLKSIVAVNLDFHNLGNGEVVVFATNLQDTALAYSGLQVFNDAPISLFGSADYFNGMASGTPVSLLIPESGVLAVGDTIPIVQFSPTLNPELFSGGRVLFDADQVPFAIGASVPEPSALVLIAIGAASVGLAVRFHKRRGDGR